MLDKKVRVGMNVQGRVLLRSQEYAVFSPLLSQEIDLNMKNM